MIASVNLYQGVKTDRERESAAGQQYTKPVPPREYQCTHVAGMVAGVEHVDSTLVA